MSGSALLPLDAGARLGLAPSFANSTCRSTVGVVIITDVRLYRDGLAHAIEACLQLRVLATAGTVRGALDCVREARPDVALLDVTMPDGLEGVRALRAADAGLTVVALAVTEVAGQVLACAEAGAAAYVTRDATLDELVETIEGAVRGETLCSPRVTATLFQRLAALDRERGGASGARMLTARELEIAALLEEGLANKAIARRLGIEVATVKNHVHNVLEKLNVRRRGEAAARLRGARLVGERPAT